MKKITSLSIILSAMFIMGCGGAVLLDAPEIISVLMDSTSVTVKWLRDSLIEGHEDALGYNIYVYTDSIPLLVDDGEDLNKYNPEVIPFPIHALATVSYTIYGLSQDSIYYIQVRTVNIDDKVGGYNADVPFVMVSPRPGFTIGMLKLEIQDAATDEDSCALRFETGEILNEINNEFPDADVFADMIDTDSAQIISASVRPNGRNTLVAKLDTTLYSYDDWDFSGFSFGSDDRQVVRKNDLLLCKTEEGNYVKVLIDEVSLITIPNYIKLTYAYQNISDFPYLSP